MNVAKASPPITPTRQGTLDCFSGNHPCCLLSCDERKLAVYDAPERLLRGHDYVGAWRRVIQEGVRSPLTLPFSLEPTRPSKKLLISMTLRCQETTRAVNEEPCRYTHIAGRWTCSVKTTMDHLRPPACPRCATNAHVFVPLSSSLFSLPPWCWKC